MSNVGAGLVRDLLAAHCEARCFRDAVVVNVGDGHGDRLLGIGDHVVSTDSYLSYYGQLSYYHVVDSLSRLISLSAYQAALPNEMIIQHCY